MVVLEHRVVEEDHHAVAGEVLERAAVLDDQRAHRRVVLAQDAEHLLGLGRVAERGEAAQVAEDGRRIAPVAGEELLALGARDQRRDLRREEAAELLLLALDRLEQLGLRGGVLDLEVVQPLVGERGADAGARGSPG